MDTDFNADADADALLKYKQRQKFTKKDVKYFLKDFNLESK